MFVLGNWSECFVQKYISTVNGLVFNTAFLSTATQSNWGFSALLVARTANPLSRSRPNDIQMFRSKFAHSKPDKDLILVQLMRYPADLKTSSSNNRRGERRNVKDQSSHKHVKATAAPTQSDGSRVVTREKHFHRKLLIFYIQAGGGTNELAMSRFGNGPKK